MNLYLKALPLSLMVVSFLYTETFAMLRRESKDENDKSSVLISQKKEHKDKKTTSQEVRATSLTNNNEEEESFILSIDGGGIRGIIPARILARIEEDIENKYELEKYGLRLAHLFDVMSGTSTGGIIALGLSAPVKEKETDLALGYPAKSLVDLYAKEGETIFPAGGPALWENFKNLFKDRYDPRPLEKLLDSYFHEHEFREATTRVIIPAHELYTNVTYIFDSIEADVPSKRYRMKDVARATSAAPTYFSAANIKNKNGDEKLFVDGGLTLNNPTEIAFEKARKKMAQKDFL